MAGYIFSSNQIPMMSVPCSVADRYLSMATGAQIKVLLCLIRFEDMPLTKADIAKQCNLCEDDVNDAINFWIKEQVLIRRANTLVLSGSVSAQPQTLPRYNAENILDKKTNDSAFSFLIAEIERILGKTLSPNDASVILAMYDHMSFGEDLIIHLINYCVSIGKSNFRYIEKVSLDWFDRGVDTFEKAEALIRALEKKARLETAVMGYFGIERALSKKEKEYIESWEQTLGMSLEMIKEAYEVCVDKKGTMKFAYINGILVDWHKKGYKQVSDIKNDVKPASNDKSYDSSDIENAILNGMVGEI